MDALIRDQGWSLIARHRAAWAEVDGLRDDAHRILRGQQPQVILDVAVAHAPARLSLALKVVAMFETEVRALTLAQEGGTAGLWVELQATTEASAANEAINSMLSLMHQVRFERGDSPDGREPSL